MAKGRKRWVYLSGRTVGKDVQGASEEYTAARCYEEVMAFLDAARVGLDAMRAMCELIEAELDDREK